MGTDENKPLIDILKGTIEEQKRINRRNFFLLILSLVMLLVTNSCWLVYEYNMADSSAQTNASLVQDANHSSNSTNNFAGQEVNMDGETGDSCDIR